MSTPLVTISIPIYNCENHLINCLQSVVNQEYKKIVRISGGKVIDHYAKLETNIPEDLGVTVQPVDELDCYNIIEIKGSPKYKGEFKIHIWAGFYAGGDAEIDKTYTFKVE